MRKFLSILVLFGICTTGQAADSDVKGSSDYPDIGRLEGSTLRKYSQTDFDEYRIFTAPIEARKDRENYVTLEGRITRIAYFAPNGVSVLEAQRNYENRLKESGFDIVFTCKSQECGGTNLTHSVEQYIGLDPFNMRYAVAEKSTPQSETHVVVATSTDGSKIVKTQVIVIESASMGNKMTDASTMKKAIVDSGSIALYGIYFDFGKSTLKPESMPTLQEIAKLLQDDTSLQLIVVGHTDNIGGYDYNMNLSRERAKSVERELVNRYGIDPKRLRSDGVGFLAPVASNRTEQGRALNRRVQLVEQPTTR